jgi:hypothetical protein
MKIKIERGEPNRVLLTEFLPYEVPMLFSNEGFFDIVRNDEHSEILEIIRNIRKPSFTKPFNYEISKGIDSGSRTLSVMNPITQLEFVEFYEEYNSLIEYYCKQSPFSLRNVDSVAKYSYSSDLVFDEDDTLKSAESETVREDGRQSKVYKSYFKYQPIDLIYKFYDRFDYRRLEQKFTYLLKFDISKCFYNIYTHSVTWAIKGKSYAKSNSAKKSFEARFDKLMQLSNYNETNGIIVGPEVSRLFAEIILSKVDRTVKEKLSEMGYKQSFDYDIRRYVDDYFIYTNDENVRKKISTLLKQELEKFKLYSNEAKHESHRTPFISDISIGKYEVKKLVDGFFEKCSVEEVDDEGNLTYSLNKPYLRNSNSISGAFVKEFQFIVRRNRLQYDQLNKDVVRLLSSGLRKIQKSSSLEIFRLEEYGNFLLAFMNILFYTYSLGMNASSTFKVSRCIVLMCKSMSTMRHADKENLMDKIISEIDVVTNIYLAKSSPEDTNISVLNLLIAMTSFEDRYLISIEKLKRLFRFKEDNYILNYFQICTLIYYTKNRRQYSELIDIAKKEIIRIVSRDDGFIDSEVIHMFMDTMTCPYLDDSFKIEVCRKSNFAGKGTSNSHVLSLVKKVESKVLWFFKWDEDINLESVLKSKEWSAVY